MLILPGISTVIADTDDGARAKERETLGNKSFDQALAELGRPFGWHDFSQYDLDAPFPDLPDDVGQNSFRTQANGIKKLAKDNGYTLRQVVEHQLASRRSPFVGSPLTVANEIQRWFEAGGFDGINVTRHGAERVRPLHRRGAADPARARRGPQRVRVDHAARQPRPAGAGQSPHRRTAGRRCRHCIPRRRWRAGARALTRRPH